MRYDLFTKLLHWGIALVIVMQMLTSLVMEEPEHGEIRSALESGSFEIHEYIGLIAFALLLTRWLWGLSGHATGGWQHLFPWLFRDGRRELLEDIRREVPAWFRGNIPEPGEHDAIAKTVHGAGLIIASIMAATGLVLFFTIDDGGELTGLAHDIGEVHEFFSTLMWIFLGGHFLMALFHQLRGHDVLGKMFLLRNSDRS
ncbi:MAG: cytochrome b/b6 domain-containing protein [Mariprofundaceae bacterium]|nr:cytochrome b/b6 domain-containing protein [Mariprofundaceae bacterium]